MADGDIQLSVTLTAKDVEAKANQLKAKVQQIFNASNGGKVSAELQNLMVKMDSLTSKSDKVINKMHEMQTTKVENPEITRLSEQYHELVSVISTLSNKETMKMITPEETQQLEQALNMARDIEQTVLQMQANGNATVSMAEVNPQKYQELTAQLNGFNNQLAVTTAKAGQAGRATSSAFSGASSNIQSSDKQLNKLASTLTGVVAKGFNKVKRASEQAFSARNIKRGLTTLIKYAFGVRSLYFLFRKLRNATKEGFENLVKYEKAVGKSKLGLDDNGIFQSTNQALTELKTSLLFLKNAWASAFAPIVNYVMPILTSLIDAMAEVGNAVARFIGALTGQSKVLNAVKVNAGDYADSLDGVGGSAKKAKDRLASFDDLNVLGKDSDAGGGGGASSLMPDPSEMFEYVDAVSEFADLIKDAWAKADFTQVGALIKDKIIGALQGINWGEVQAEAERLGKSAGTFLAGLFGDPQLFIEGGKAIAEGFNTITVAIQAFLEETKGVDFGGNFAQGVNEFLQLTNWQQAGANINEAFTQINDNIQSFLNTLNESDVATAISDFISGLDIPQMLAETGQTAITLTIKSIKIFASTIAELGRQLGEYLVVYVTKDRFIKFMDEGEEIVVPYTPKFDWKENPLLALGDAMLFDLGQRAVDAMGLEITPENIGALNEAFKPLNDFANGTLLGGAGGGLGIIFDTSKWSEEAKTVVATLSAISEILNGIVGFNPFYLVSGFQKLNEATGFLEPLLQGVYDIFYNIGAIAMTVLNPVYQLGQAIGEWWVNINGFQGVLDGVYNIFYSIGQFAMTILDPVYQLGQGIGMAIEAVGNEFAKIPDKLNEYSENWSAFWTGIGETVALGIEYVVWLYNDLKTKVEQSWENLKSSAMQKWGEIQSAIREKIESIKQSAVEKFESLKNTVLGAILMLKDKAILYFMGFKSGVYNVFMTLKDMLKTPINAIIGVIESFVNKIIDGLNSLISKFSKISDGFSDVASEYGISIPTLSPINSITIPRLAQGAVIPPNKEFMAVLGDQKNGTNIEAPLDTIKQAVAEVMGANGNAEVVQLLQQLITVVENKNLTIGDKEIGKANARYTNQQRMIRGTSF